MAKVDATVAEKTSSSYEVEGYPTIKFVANGFPIDYRSGRTAEDMQEWLDSFFTSQIETVTEAQVKEKIGSEDFLLVQGVSAAQLEVLQIANFVDEAVKYYLIADGEFRVTLHLKKDSKALDYSGALSVKELTAWTLGNSLPVVVPLNSEAQTRTVFENEEKLPSFLLFRTGDFSEDSFGRLEQICEANKAVFKCAFADSSSTLFDGVARYLGISDKSASLLAYIKYGLKEGYKFPAPHELSGEAVAQFLEEVREGKVEKLVDTEKDKKEREVKYVNVLKLTADTYNQTLADNKYLFVEYYSPNCGHCVRFAPEYEKLATRVKEESLGFAVAAVDLVTESKVGEWVEVQGYPTLRLIVSGKSIDYQGERDSQAIIQFVTSAMKSKLLAAASRAEVAAPAALISGVSEDSDLHLLPLLFSRHPVYLLPGGEFRLELLTAKGSQSYSGDVSLEAIADWLESTTEPVVVGIVDDKPTKRLSQALQGKAPLLVIVRREETVSGRVLSVLEEFCEGEPQVVCGYAAKADKDYESFSEWLGDKENDQSVLVYVDTNKFEKTLYSGDLATLTAQDVATFFQTAHAAANKIEESKEETEAVPEAAEKEEAGEEL